MSRATLIMTAGFDAPLARTGLCPACQGKKFSHGGELGKARRSTQPKCPTCRGAGYVAVGSTKR